MKQTIVIKISMNGQKARTKALKIAVGVAGVEKAEVKGDEKNQIAVTGEGIDSTELTVLIRKKVGRTELISVTPIGEKKEEEKKKIEAAPMVWPTPVYHYEVQPIAPSGYYYHEVQHSDSCTIM